LCLKTETLKYTIFPARCARNYYEKLAVAEHASPQETKPFRDRSGVRRALLQKSWNTAHFSVIYGLDCVTVMFWPPTVIVPVLAIPGLSMTRKVTVPVPLSVSRPSSLIHLESVLTAASQFWAAVMFTE
jgi:hypothetical protein